MHEARSPFDRFTVTLADGTRVPGLTREEVAAMRADGEIGMKVKRDN